MCLYFKKNLKATVLEQLSQISESNFHKLWIKIQSKKNKSIVICVTYRPPDCALNCFEDYFKPNYIQALTISISQPIFILGDVNCDMLHEGPNKKALFELATELNLKQIIEEPTRITDATQSLIDVILALQESGVLNCTISDHLPVYIILKLKAPKIPLSYITTRSYKCYNPSNFSALRLNPMTFCQFLQLMT